MDSVGVLEAKTHFSALLERAERGESITITKHGRPVARLLPAGGGPADVERRRALAVERLKTFADGGQPLGGPGVKALRDEGRP